MKFPVYRIESAGESPVSFPTLARALAMPPRHSEACIATSLDGIHLADALPCSMEQASFVSAEGVCLCWRLTLAGSDVAAASGWRVAA